MTTPLLRFLATETRHLEQAGLSYPEPTLGSPQGPTIVVGGHTLANYASSDYLGLATQAIRASGTRADVGIVLNWSPVYPATQSPEDIAMARLEDGTLVRWYLDALLRVE